MVIKVFIGPKEKKYYEEQLRIMGWDKDELECLIVENLNESFFDKIQCAPNGIEFVEEDKDFDVDDANETLQWMAEDREREYNPI